LNNSNFNISQAKFDKISKSTQNNIQQDKKLKDVCDNFESFFMQQIMDISLQSSNVAGSGTGSDIIKGMYTEAISTNSSGSLGISDMLYRYLSKKD
jgi:Rod binding domain-containing protein